MSDRPLAIVTGASRGIGRAIALGLASEGYDIAGVARTLESSDTKLGLNDLKHEIEAHGVNFQPLQADVRDIKHHPQLVSEIIGRFGRIDMLVNNAGVAPEKRLDILETTHENFHLVLSTNLAGAFFLTQAAVHEMLDLKTRLSDYHPKIIFITSISAKTSSLDRAEYCISKAALSMAAKIFADRLAGPGINVYEIRPGIIETDMTAGVKQKYDKLIEDGLVPQGRWGLPDDVAKTVTAIAQGNFDYSTGMVFEVSGGMNIRRL